MNIILAYSAAYSEWVASYVIHVGLGMFKFDLPNAVSLLPNKTPMAVIEYGMIKIKFFIINRYILKLKKNLHILIVSNNINSI